MDSVCLAASPPQGYSAAVAPGPCEAPPSRGSFYCFRFFVATLRAASFVHPPLACFLFLVRLTLSLRFLSKVLETHSPLLATGTGIVREEIESFTNPLLPRATNCVPRRLSTTTFTIAHFLRPYDLLIFLFTSLLAPFSLFPSSKNTELAQSVIKSIAIMSIDWSSSINNYNH